MTIYMYIFIHNNRHKYLPLIYIHIYIYVYMYIYMHICTYIYTHICTYIYIYIFRNLVQFYRTFAWILWVFEKRKKGNVLSVRKKDLPGARKASGNPRRRSLYCGRRREGFAKGFAEGFAKGFAKALAKGFAKDCGNDHNGYTAKSITPCTYIFLYMHFNIIYTN